MLEEFSSEVKSHLYDRIRSPLSGAFIVSWCLWNHWPIFAILSELSFLEKVQYIQMFYHTKYGGYHFIPLIAAPLASAILFLVAYPIPSRWIYKYWAVRQKELRSIRQSIEDATPLTHAEAKFIKDLADNLRRELENKTNELIEITTDQRKQHRETSEEKAHLNARIADLTIKLEEMEKAKAERTTAESNDAVSPQPVQSNNLVEVTKEAPSFLESVRIKLDKNALSHLTARLGNEDNAVNIIFGFVHLGGTATVTMLASSLSLHKTYIQLGLVRLRSSDLIEATSNPDEYRLTLTGNQLAAEFGLPEYTI